MNIIQYKKMPAFKCEKCYKIFNLKTDLDRHHNKKNPCMEVGQIINEKAKEIAETTTKNNDDVAKVKKFLDFSHNTLRDKEGIVGMKALSNIAMLLFLKFVNNSVKTGNIDLLNIEKYRSEEGSITEPFKKYKKYIKYCKFENIIKDGKFNNDFELNELPTIIEFIFRHMLWHHPKTKNIFTDEIPTIKNDITYEQILKQMDKLNWDDMDIDVKGLAYEHFLKNEMGGGELGQFFTRREVVDYMINIIKPQIKETSTFIDPFMGTGGFITHMFNEMRNIYTKKNIPFTDEIKNNLVSGIEKNPQTCLLALNNMLINMDLIPVNVKCDDSFRNYINNKYDFCITNPPFGIKGLSFDDESMFPKEKNGIIKNKYLPHKSNDAICLALQMIQYILNKNGIGAIVVPDGKQMNSEKEKSLIAVRKMLIEENNLFQITKLPSGTFLPYTGVETMILFFKKGEKTKDIKFVKLDENYKSETFICNVNIKKIIEKKYSLNYKLYCDMNQIKYKNLQYLVFSDVFLLEKGDCSSKNTEECIDGDAILINWSMYGNYKKIKNGKYTGKNVFISTTLPNGKEKGYFVVSYYDGNCSSSNLMSKLCINNEYINNINIKFYYYFLKFNAKYIEDNYQKGCANKSLDIQLFNKMQIPVPPIEVQNLIVKELDSMYKQKESLQNAINEMNNYRKVQFEMLLSKCKDVKNVKLEKLCEFNKNSNNENEFDEYHYIDISSVSEGKLIEKKNIKKNELPSRAKRYGKINDILLSSVRPNLKNFLFLTKNELSENTVISTGFIMITSNSKLINPKYLYYNVSDDTTTEILVKKTTGANYPSINTEDIKDILFSVPSLQDQELIVKQMEKYDELVKLQQAQIDEIDTTIKARFEFHLEKCKETKSTQVKETEENEEIEEDELNNGSNTKKPTVKSKPVTKNKTEIEDLETEFEEESLKTSRPKDKIKVDETSNKSSKSVKSTIKNTQVKTPKEEVEEPIEIVLVGKVECINENGNYYKFSNGKKGELYAKTSNGKVILYKKPIVKKVETMEDELEEMEKELNNIPKTKNK